MKTALVGYTGFVGGNLYNSHKFDEFYNSKNIADAFNTKPDLLIYSGLPAAKFLANSNEKGDFDVCMNAFENIKKINPKKLVLISTVDVYKTPVNVDEDTKASVQNHEAYGKNRALLEQKVAENFDNALIIRLPGLYGNGLKKNFIYDFLTLTPSMLKKEKYEELSSVSELVKKSYEIQPNGFFALTQKAKIEDKKALKSYFESCVFNSLYFTDSRAYYQFYNLAFLWQDINTALNNNLNTLNIAVEPVCTHELYEKLTGSGTFKNEIAAKPVFYDMHTKYADVFGKKGQYLYTKQEVINSIYEFVKNANF